MKTTSLPQSVELFTISFDKKNENTAELNLGLGENACFSVGRVRTTKPGL
jgi:hypothetical protein